MAWTDKTWHKMFKCSFNSPSVLYKVDFGRTKQTHMQNVIELLLKDDVALLTPSLSSSPAIVRNASILNLPKFVFICTLSFMYTSFKGLTFIKKRRYLRSDRCKRPAIRGRNLLATTFPLFCINKIRIP